MGVFRYLNKQLKIRMMEMTFVICTDHQKTGLSLKASMQKSLLLAATKLDQFSHCYFLYERYPVGGEWGQSLQISDTVNG